MVVFAAGICTKAGKPLISRQFREMPRSRIESLIASFPKLIPPNSQHTSIETEEVRYVYQPLEDLYILLVTNKASNILQDIDTLQIFARVVSDMCRSAEAREIYRHAFDLLGAFDEIISLGYREQVNLMQVRNILEMESHEEKIQEIIARNKEAEAKEELKRRAKQLEMQRREQQRRAQAGIPGGGSSYLGGSGGMGAYSPVPRYEAPSPVPRTASPAAAPVRSPAFKGSGMKLGSKKTSNAQFLDTLGAEVASTEDLPASSSYAESVPASIPKNTGISIPTVEEQSVHIQIKEQLSLSLFREGGVKSLDLKGDMNLKVSDPSLGRIQLALAPLNPGIGPELQFKQHPQVNKFTGTGERIVALKDPSRSFPVGQPLAVVKWRYIGKDEVYSPLAINCWPSPSNDGTCDVNIEYELERDNITLYNLTISIPLPAGSYPTVGSSPVGEWALNTSSHSLDWSIPVVSPSDDTRSGNLEFSIGGDDPSAFFPVRIFFTALGSVAGVSVASVTRLDGQEEPSFSQEAVVQVDNFTVSQE
ncbi:hypothetical protein SISNIDRAFT_80111 [Sistotremastrum niveocremeum HHB9708]|uniref:Coatomer subunit delta n=1 Tax=Sistotremastrum niveocremeum HHB9708 TaxID=1314777 RepID=A0A164UMM5_9AGAM|nr:hypothetical protein SISNIDRAFT_80111 [Sistotremastrum niveocremeum HHB9708]